MMKPLPLGGLSLETFLAEYWQKKPLLIRNAISHIQPPIAGDELAGLACEPCVESRLVIQDGASDRWELTHGPFTEETFQSLPQKHWTLLVQAVDHWVPAAAEFLAPFHFIPTWRIDDLMISYSGDGGGVGPHYDNYDVFLVQTQGRRQWEIGGRYDAHSPRRPDTPVMILKDWEPQQQWVLDPGDILYVPPQIGHNGIAVGDACMTCSVGFRAPSHSEILRGFADFVGDTLSDELRYVDADLVPQVHPSSLTSGTLQKVHEILSRHLQDKELLADWFGRFVTAPKYLDEESSELTHDLQDLHAHSYAGGILRRNEGARFVFHERVGEGWLFVDGHRYRYREEHAQLIKELCESRRINPRPYLQVEALGQLLLDLLNRGSLYIPD